jgi:hypothetical protein
MRTPVVVNLRGLVAFHKAHPKASLQPMDVALIQSALSLIEELQAESVEWRERYEAERRDHEASLKQAEEVERNLLDGGRW